MSSVHVAMVTPYFEPVRGGITSFVRGLSDELRRMGVDVTIVSREGLPRSDVLIHAGNPLFFVRQATRAIRKTQPDVIHGHGHWYTLKAAVKARGATSAKVVFSFHTAWATKGIVRKRILRGLLERCDYVTFPSWYLRDSMDLRLPADMMKVIHPGVSALPADSGARNRMREDLGLAKCKRIVGYVGQFQWHEKVRGFRILLEALSLPRLRDIGLVAAGGGSLLRDMQEYAVKLGVGERVLFLGEVPDTHMIYAGCDVYCHASLQETIGLAVLEAMRCGCAIVGFRKDFMKETITDGREGILVEPEAESLAEAITQILDDPVIAERLGMAAQRKAEAEFDWSRAARAFLDLYGVSA